MTEAISIYAFFLGTALVVSVPLSVLIGLPLLSWNLRAFIGLKEREVRLRQLQSALRVQRDAEGVMPRYIDRSDPEAVLAWARVESQLQAH